LIIKILKKIKNNLTIFAISLSCYIKNIGGFKTWNYVQFIIVRNAKT